MAAVLAYLKEFNFLSAVVRLILAMACGSVVGFGRSKKKQNAGLRTYVLTSIGAESGEIPYTAYFAAKSFLTDNGDTVQRFTNAIAKALDFVQTHSADEVAEIIAPQFPDTSVETLTKVVQRYVDIDAWNATPVMEQQALERLETVMETAGVLQHHEWVKFDQLVDNSFAEKAVH